MGGSHSPPPPSAELSEPLLAHDGESLGLDAVVAPRVRDTKKAPVVLRFVVTAALVVLPIALVTALLAVVPLSGSYEVPDGGMANFTATPVARTVFAWYFNFVYSATSVGFGLWIISAILYPLPGWLNALLTLPFCVMVSLVFQYAPVTLELRFVMTAVGVPYSILLQLLAMARVGRAHPAFAARNWLIFVGQILLLLLLYLVCTLVLIGLRPDKSDVLNGGIGLGSLIGRQTVISMAFQVGGILQRMLVFNIGKCHASYEDPSRVNVAHMVTACSHMVYFTFYRIVFSEISSAFVFVAMQLVAAALEVFSYFVLLVPRVTEFRNVLVASIVGLLQRALPDSVVRRLQETEQMREAAAAEAAEAAAAAAAAAAARSLPLADLSSASGGGDDSDWRAKAAVEELLAAQDRPGRYVSVSVDRAVNWEELGRKRAQLQQQRVHAEASAKAVCVYRSTSFEYMLRHVSNLFSIAAYLTVALLYHQLSWVRYEFDAVTTAFDGDTLMYIGISGAVDVLLVLGVSLLWKLFLRRSIWSHWWSVIRRPHWGHFWFVILFAVHVGFDLIIALINDVSEAA